MKEDQHLHELEPETYPDRRIRLILDNQGSRHSITLHVWMLMLIFVLIMAGVVVLGVFAFRGKAEAKPLPKGQVEQENQLLRKKLKDYEAGLDSLKTRLDSLQTKQKGEITSYPYFGGSMANRSENKLLDNILITRLDSIEGKLSELRQAMGAIAGQFSSQFALPTGFATHGDGIPSIYPTFGELTSKWGMRLHPVLNVVAFHTGIDIANRVGTPVYATADGIVSVTHNENGFGKVVVVNHKDGYQTKYAHLYSFKVKPGEVVRKGQIIALMGNTGMSTGPHLHYCVFHNGEVMNPECYLNRMDTTDFARI
jgi:murein DD-endopeptidase MepM/ murein hydrolase activator NlpD